jgi:hypothetical protein
MKMNRKSLEKMLAKTGYVLRETSDSEARWMIVSTLSNFHWSFKTLASVHQFALDEKNMRSYANRILAMNS